MSTSPAPTAARVVAVDVGGTLMKGAVATVDGTLEVRHRVATPRRAGSEAILTALRELVDVLVAAAPGPVGSVGIAVPGVVDETEGRAVRAANLPWEDLALADHLGQHLGRPVRVGHDVRCGALAEARLGAGRGASSLLFVPIGTGIGGAAILDGRVVTGAHAGALELGHVVVDPRGPRCGCGRQGCLETLASAAAVARAYADRAGRDPDTVDGELVARAVAAGDRDAAAVWTIATDALGTALGTACTLLDPEIVVVGGGLGRAGELLLDPVRDALDAYRTFEPPVRIVGAELGDEAGCIGAALLAADGTGTGGPCSPDDEVAP